MNRVSVHPSAFRATLLRPIRRCRIPQNASPDGFIGCDLFCLPPFPPRALQTLHLQYRTSRNLPYLQHLQFAQALLYQLLYCSLFCHILAVPERIASSPFGVFAEIVGGELAALAQEGAVLQRVISQCSTTREATCARAVHLHSTRRDSAEVLRESHEATHHESLQRIYRNNVGGVRTSERT